MTFTCTYRDSRGARLTTVVEAKSRADAYSQLSAKGIRPLSLVQGGKMRAEGAGGKPPKASKGLLAGLLVVALALGAAYFMGLFDAGNRPDSTSKSKPESQSAERPVQAKKAPASKKDAPPEVPAKSVRVQKENEGAGAGSLPAAEAGVDAVSTNDAAGAVDPAVTNKPKRIFKTGAEELLVLATPSTPGGMVPPLPNITDEGVAKDLAKAMSNVIKADKDDTEKTLSLKLNVAEQKEEFRSLQKEEGWTFTEYVNALRDKFNDDAAYLSEARKLNEELYKDQSLSDADYEANKKQLDEELKKRGLPSLDEE